jgi:hypothetical protein
MGTSPKYKEWSKTTSDNINLALADVIIRFGNHVCGANNDSSPIEWNITV